MPDSPQEEDFVTNTYERSLLSHIPVPDIKRLLQKAVTDLRASKDGFPQQIYIALESRLQLRLRFLDAIDLSSIRDDTSETPKLPWLQMKRLIDDIEDQHVLGKPVPEAFSTKLQRRLASTMPPRPMVKLSFEECIAHFKRLVQNGNEVIDVLQYTDPQSLLVCFLPYLPISTELTSYRILYSCFKPRNPSHLSSSGQSFRISCSRIWWC